MRRRLCLALFVVLVGGLVAGCVITPSTTVATTAHRQTGQPAPVISSGKDRRSESQAAEVGVKTTRRKVVAAAEPSPWGVLQGAVEAPSASVAHTRGAVPVSADAGGPVVAVLPGTTRVGAPRVLLVIGETAEWLQVLLPVRPNGSVGWVRRADVDVSTVGFRVEIDRAAHRLRLFDAGAVVMDEPVAIGRAATPTPAGQFFITELLRPPNPRGPYGTFAFTLSAYSNVYQRFGSGDGAVGLHGTNEPSSLGGDASHGCVRVDNAVIERLATMLPLGTPVVIR